MDDFLSNPYVFSAIKLAAAVLLIILNGIFVAAEFAFVRVRPTRIMQLINEGSAAARTARFGVEHLDAYLSVSQLGITLASLGLGWLGEPAVSSLLEPLLCRIGITEAAVHSLSVLIGFIIITFLHVVFGELAPKTLSIQKCEKMVLSLALPMKIFYYLFLPFVLLLNGTANLVVRGGKNTEDEVHSLEELRILVEDSVRADEQKAESESEVQPETEKSIEEEEKEKKEQTEKELLRKVFYFEKKDARDIMVPRLDTHCLSITDSEEENRRIIAATKHTRYPVMGREDGRVCGILNIKDIVVSDKPLMSVLTEPMYVSENISLDRLLDKMQKKSQQLAVVVDEYGLFQGIVSSEDVVEELVGELKDEYDADEKNMLTQLSQGVWTVSGKLSLGELKDRFDIEYDAEEKDVATVAGFVMEQIGHIPAAGESFVYSNSEDGENSKKSRRFTVTEMDNKRIMSVKIEVLNEEQEK